MPISKMMKTVWLSRISAIILCGIFILSGFLIPREMPETSKDVIFEEIKAEISSATTYPNSDMTSLWIRKNGSDPDPFGYPNPNVAPTYGMTYFGTNVIQVAWGYSWTEINNTALFPTDCVMYIQTDYTVSSAGSISNHSKFDSRIRGMFIDDFTVSTQSPANMSSIYTAAHQNDDELGYNITLALIVYNRNYYDQTPYSWPDICDYFDIIHYWFYPNTYPLLLPQFCGYEDGIKELKAILPDKEFWLGIYLHYYNLGDYPLNFTYEQMSNACKMIKLEYATRLSILENFWIQHNTPTAELVRDFINDEYKSNYTSHWYWGSQTVVSSSNGIGEIYPYVTEIEAYHQIVSRDGYTFRSTKFQTFIVHSAPSETMTEYHAIWDLRTGKYQYPYYFNGSYATAYYILEPDSDYRILYFQMSTVYYDGDLAITGDSSWDSLHVIINGTLNISGQLAASYCIIEFGINSYNNSMVNYTMPEYGITIQHLNEAELRLYDCIVQPENRAFPYHFRRLHNDLEGVNGELNFIMARTVIACHSGNYLWPTGEIYLTDTTFFQVQPHGDTYNYLLYITAPSRVSIIEIEHCLFWNYDVLGSVGLFLMVGETYESGNFYFINNTIVGGNYGLWIDMAYTPTGLTIPSYSSRPAYPDSTLFCTFRFDGGTDKHLNIETETIFDWSVKSSLIGISYTMYYPVIDNGVYNLVIDNDTYSLSVSNNQLYITYGGPWKVYRNNFTLSLFSDALNTVETMDDLLTLFIIFIIPIMMAQLIPRIGFIVGMSISLVVWSIIDSSFIPYMLLSVIAIGIITYKRL
jgi:hypothetical protein